MKINPTQQGGRRIQGTTAWGDFDIVTDDKGFPISGFPIKIKTPDNAKPIRKAINAATAILTAPHVSRETFEARQAACKTCEHNANDHCNVCGCKVQKEYKAIWNLPKHKENLPHWGCKHPERSSGKGWKE